MQTMSRSTAKSVFCIMRKTVSRMLKSMFRKVLAQAPTTVSALGGLAVVKRKLGDSDEALELIRKANTVDPNNDWIKLEYANLLRAAGQTDEAVSIFEVYRPDIDDVCEGDDHAWSNGAGWG